MKALELRQRRAISPVSGASPNGRGARREREKACGPGVRDAAPRRRGSWPVALRSIALAGCPYPWSPETRPLPQTRLFLTPPLVHRCAASVCSHLCRAQLRCAAGRTSNRQSPAVPAVTPRAPCVQMRQAWPVRTHRSSMIRSSGAVSRTTHVPCPVVHSPSHRPCGSEFFFFFTTHTHGLFFERRQQVRSLGHSTPIVSPVARN